MIKNCLNLYKKYEEIINYIVVGGVTTIISILSYYLFRIILSSNTNLNVQISTVFSWIVAVTFAYFANRIFVFKSNNSRKTEAVKFVTSRIMSLLIEMLVMFILTSVVKINDKVAKVLVQFIIVILNYLFSKIFVFKK
jgi:putative cell wall teichoic acid glycosylation protein gtcA